MQSSLTLCHQHDYGIMLGKKRTKQQTMAVVGNKCTKQQTIAVVGKRTKPWQQTVAVVGKRTKWESAQNSKPWQWWESTQNGKAHKTANRGSGGKAHKMEKCNFVTFTPVLSSVTEQKVLPKHLNFILGAV